MTALQSERDGQDTAAPDLLCWRSRARRLFRTCTPLALACVLWTAAGLKGYQLARTPSSLQQDMPRLLTLALVEAEILFGAVLCLGVWHAVVCRLGAALFLAFACAAAYKGISHARDCGCFGPVTVNPWVTMAFDLAASVLLWPAAGAGSRGRPPRWTRTALICVVAPAAGVGGVLMARGPAVQMVPDGPMSMAGEASAANSGGVLILDPHEWIGKRFPLLTHIQRVAEVSTGTWRILFYHHDCQACRTTLATLAGAQTRQLVLVSVPPHAPDNDPATQVNAPTARLPADQTWFIQTPVMVILTDGRVVEAMDEAKLARSLGLEEHVSRH